MNVFMPYVRGMVSRTGVSGAWKVVNGVREGKRGEGKGGKEGGNKTTGGRCLERKQTLKKKEVEEICV